MQTYMTKLVIAFRDLEPAPGKMEFSDSILRYKDSRLVGEWNPRHSLQGSLYELVINNKAHNVRVLPYYRRTIYYAICITHYCFINKVKRELNFDVLLTVHLSIFISVNNQLDAQHFCFTIRLFHASTCFEHMCSSSGGKNFITQPLVSSHL